MMMQRNIDCPIHLMKIIVAVVEGKHVFAYNSSLLKCKMK